MQSDVGVDNEVVPSLALCLGPPSSLRRQDRLQSWAHRASSSGSVSIFVLLWQLQVALLQACVQRATLLAGQRSAGNVGSEIVLADDCKKDTNTHTIYEQCWRSAQGITAETHPSTRGLASSYVGTALRSAGCCYSLPESQSTAVSATGRCLNYQWTCRWPSSGA